MFPDVSIFPKIGTLRDLLEMATLSSPVWEVVGGAAEVLRVSWQRLLESPHVGRVCGALPAGWTERCLRNVSGLGASRKVMPGGAECPGKAEPGLAAGLAVWQVPPVIPKVLSSPFYQ